MRGARGYSCKFENRTERDMNTADSHSKRPKRNLTWGTQPGRAHSDHQYETIAHLLGDALKRCLKCGSLEKR